MEEFFNILGNVGFPIAVTAFLLIRVERKLDELNSTLIKLMELLVHKE